MRSDRSSDFSASLGDQLLVLGGLLALMWGVEIVDFFLRGRLDWFGIIPRTTVGLGGIVFAPFLHGNFRHLIANSVPFIVLGWLVMLRCTSDFWVVSGVSMLVGGFGAWLFGAPRSVHIGASGVIFGYFGFLLVRAWLEKSVSSILLALIAAGLYGGLIWGVLPLQRGVSWQAHLFGLIGGGIAAWLLARES